MYCSPTVCSYEGKLLLSKVLKYESTSVLYVRKSESTFESTSVCSCTRVQYVYFIPNEGFSGSTVTGVQLYTHGTVRVHVCLFLYGYKYTYCTYLQWPYLIFEGVSKIEYTYCATLYIQENTFVRKYESTFVLSYENKKVRKYNVVRK